MLIVILLLRLILSLSTRTYFQPDEYFQSLEVAHWMRYGFGYLTWEWENRIRSVAYPAIYAVGYTLGDWANIPVQVTPKILNALFAAIQDIALIAFMRREYGNEKAMSYTLLAFTNVYDLYTRHRSLSNTAEAALTSVALFYWPFRRSSRGQQIPVNQVAGGDIFSGGNTPDQRTHMDTPSG
ncbi:GPI mannosyltransferase 3 [Wallemia ichthyophaga EXF-994]|uniref:Mannosyltransferase n=1 Tax=Wallemia ichthyophaga (strain EXF-994 / CBS 113033) TaxID=1299270 RepID=R9AHA1_WALI9|nr:GPI mannosyltransferase 3 [Wallemia ichthyophaga EXF-994]EOR01573.1 GPI mannosyltransferase 3 [Wallemia ichthyophaga EXF-994]